MKTLCEAFNRINSRFGANRVKLLAVADDGETLWFEIVGYGRFDLSCFQGVACVGSYDLRDSDKQREVWLSAIANGATRDDEGKVV